MSKGITPVIAIILLLLITISIVGFAFIFFQRTTETASAAGQEQLQQQISQAGTKLRIESIAKNKVYVRNLGSRDLSNIAVFVNGVKVDSDNPTIAPNSVGTITLNDAQLAMLPDPAELSVTSGGLPDKIKTNFYTTNTVGYWTFDEADREKVKDYSGNNNHGTFTIGSEGWRDGTLVNGPAVVTGKYGNALDFAAGIDDYVEIADHPSLDFGTGAFTISAWIYVDSFASQFVIFYKETDTLGNAGTIGYSVHVGTGGAVIFRLRTSTADQSVRAVGIQTGRWYHVAGVSDGANSKVYIDGVDRTSSNDITGTVNTDNSVTALIGSGRHVNHQGDGKIDEVRIYNKALTQQEIQENMNSPYPIARTVASYSFEKIENNKALDTHNTVKGKYGAAMSFDGVDDFVNIAGFGNGAPTSEISIDAWVILGEIKNQDLFSFDPLVGGNRITVHFPWDAGIHWQFGKPLQSLTTQLPNVGEWNHYLFVASSSGNFMKIYKNGNEVATKTGMATFERYAGDWHIAGRTSSSFKGTIDEVRILNIARS